MGFWSDVKEKALAVAKHVPGAKIAESFGEAYYLRKAADAQDRLTEKNWEMQQKLLERIRRARAEGDGDRVKRLMKGLESTTKTNLVKDQLNQTMTNKEIIGDGVQLALLATLGFKPSTMGAKSGLAKMTGKGLPFTKAGREARATVKFLDGIYKGTKAMSAAERVRQYGTWGKVINKSIPIMKEAAIGSGFWGAMSYSEGDSPSKIAKEASKGAVISGGITAGVGVLAGLLSKGARTASPHISKAWRKTILKLEDVANPGAKQTDNVVDEILADIPKRKSIKQRFANGTLRTIGEARKLEQKLIDRFAPLKRMENRLGDVKGSPLKDDELFLMNFRTAQPRALGIAEDEVNNMFSREGVMGSYFDIEDVVKANIKNLDEIDRVKVFAGQIDDELATKLKVIDEQLANKQITPQIAKGLKTKANNMATKQKADIGSRVASGKDLTALEETQARLLSSLDGPTKARLNSSLNDWNNYHKALLQHRVNAGLISKESMEHLLKTHPNYMPHNVIREIDDAAAEAFAITDTLNVGKTDIMKAKGSAKQIADPYIASSERTVSAWQIIENNKALRGLVEAQEQYKFVDDANMYKVKTGTKAPKDKQTINLYRNGVKETWVVPEDVAAATKGIYDTPKDVPILGKPFVWANNIMKKAATSMNLSFALPNKFRDLQTAAITADAFIDAMIKKTGAKLPGSPIYRNKEELLTLWKKSGGSGSSIFREGKVTSKILDDLKKTGIRKHISNTNPAKVINNINEALEESTRLDVFQRALNRGLTPKQAAMVSREATIDFAKMGSWTRELNQYIPFLNARVQGFVNLPKAFINNPTNFARVQLWTSVYPTLGLYKHNRQFESYGNISQYFKDKYWVVMTGEVDGKDTDGNDIKIPKFITIPKGEGQSLVSNPIQYFMEKADGLDYRTVDEMMVDTIGSASPLSFQGWSGTNVWTSLISQFGPAASIPVGLGTNIEPFSGRDIVPGSRKQAEKDLQFRYTTPQTTKDIANFMGVAPAKLEFVINSFGGLAQDIQTSVDIVTNKVKGRELGLNPLEDSAFGQATRLPLLRRIFREVTESFGPEQTMLRERKAEEQTKIVSERLKIKDKANEIVTKMDKITDPNKKQEYLKGLADKGEITPEIEEKMIDIRKTRQSVDQIRKTDSVELRAKLIVKQLNDLGSDLDARQEFLMELEEADIMSEKTIKRVIGLLKGGFK